MYFNDISGIGCHEGNVCPPTNPTPKDVSIARSAAKLDKLSSGIFLPSLIVLKPVGLHAIETGELRIRCAYSPTLFYWPGLYS